MAPCGLRPGPLAFSCMAMTLHTGEALALIHSHANSFVITNDFWYVSVLVGNGNESFAGVLHLGQSSPMSLSLEKTAPCFCSTICAAGTIAFRVAAIACQVVCCTSFSHGRNRRKSVGVAASVRKSTSVVHMFLVAATDAIHSPVKSDFCIRILPDGIGIWSQPFLVVVNFTVKPDNSWVWQPLSLVSIGCCPKMRRLSHI